VDEEEIVSTDAENPQFEHEMTLLQKYHQITGYRTSGNELVIKESRNNAK